MKIFITNLTVSGVKNISEKLNFIFHKPISNNLFDIDNSNVKAIYGPNGAGKSAIIHAVQIYKKLLTTENYLVDSQTKNYVNELINYSTKEIFIKIEYVIYQKKTFKILFVGSHEISIKQNDLNELYISHEKLESKKYTENNTKQNTVVFEVLNGVLMRSSLSNKIKEQTLNLLKKRSLVEVYFNSIYFSMDKEKSRSKSSRKTGIVDSCRIDFMELYPSFFLANQVIINLEEGDDHYIYTYRKSMDDDFCYGGIPCKNITSNFMTKENLSHSGLSLYTEIIPEENIDEYKKHLENLTKFIKIFKPNLVKIESEYKEGDGYFTAERYFCYEDCRVYIDFESNGIKKLVGLFKSLEFLAKGYIVFIDEFDANINDVYLTKLLEYFSMTDTGQFIFTTHNVSPMKILQSKNNSIDFISYNGQKTSWKKNGNYSASSLYKKGMIDKLPFNIDSFDFINVFGEEDE